MKKKIVIPKKDITVFVDEKTGKKTNVYNPNLDDLKIPSPMEKL